MPTIRALSALGRAYALVINQAPARSLANAPSRLIDDGPVLPVVISTRVDHQYAYALSQGVQEFAPAGKATAEIVELWRTVRIRMGLMNGVPERLADDAAGRSPQRELGGIPLRRSNFVRSEGPSSGQLAVGRRPRG
jgi:hypothetical protein